MQSNYAASAQTPAQASANAILTALKGCMQLTELCAVAGFG